MELTKDQITMLREAWNEQSKDLNSGGVPILAAGLKWESLSMTSQDAELVAAWKMTVEDISRVFRVPPMLINNMENATFSNADALMSFWLSSGLGFLIKHIEASMKAYFNLPPSEYIELDTEILMRTNLEGRIKALGEAVTKGIYSPNEARRRENLGPVEGGDMPRVQQQMVPLNWEIPNTARITSPQDEEDEEPADDITDEELSFLPILIKAKLRELQNAS
jgi:HK97 family phage portal protein